MKQGALAAAAAGSAIPSMIALAIPSAIPSAMPMIAGAVLGALVVVVVGALVGAVAGGGVAAAADQMAANGRSSNEVPDDLLPMKRRSSLVWLPPNMSELRVVLLGNSWSERSSVRNFILGETKFITEDEPDHCVMERGGFKEKEIVLINTPDLLQPNIPEDKLRQHVATCKRLSGPGPHVFLLVLQPEDFTEEVKGKLCRVLDLFSELSFDHSLILISTPREESSAFTDIDRPLKDLIRKCRYRNLNRKNLERPELLTRLGQVVKENNGHMRRDVLEDEGLIRTPKSDHMKPSLNLVLCGRTGAGKTSAAKAILGQKELHSVSNSSQCVKHRGEVSGRQVSLVELPALCGKAQEEVMEEPLRCISLCDPEGIHAFFLVQRVGPLTDEEQGEPETIKNSFCSPVNDFTMILFIVDSDPKATAAVDFLQEDKEIQELIQSCGGRYFVLNIKDQQQIPELLDYVEKMSVEGSRCFTKDMFTKAQMEKVSRLEAELQVVKQKTEVGFKHQLVESLRMVLIGPNSSGKSATANTILDKKVFKPRIIPKPMTRSLQTARGVIDGRLVDVVNIPGLFDTTLSDAEIQQECKKCICMLSPGPHVFLLVLQIGNFTQEDKDSVELIKKYFGDKSADFITIIFTRGDALEEESFESYIKDCDDSVKELIRDCGGRYQVFNNKEDTDRTQVTELLSKIETMVKVNGGCYYTEMFDTTEGRSPTQVERIFKEKEEEMKRRDEDLRRKHEEDLKEKEEEMKRRDEDLRRKHEEDLKEKEQEMKRRDEDLRRKHEEDLKSLKNKFKEDERKLIAKQLEDVAKERRKGEEEERRRKKQEETQRQEWRRKLEASEKMVQSEREQKENAVKKQELLRKEMKRDRDAFDKERMDTWERIHQEDKKSLEEEKKSSKEFQDYHQKKRKWIYFVFFVSGFLLFQACNIFLR